MCLFDSDENGTSSQLLFLEINVFWFFELVEVLGGQPEMEARKDSEKRSSAASKRTASSVHSNTPLFALPVHRFTLYQLASSAA